MKCDYSFEKYSQAYGKNASWFGHSTKDNILQLYTTQVVFRTGRIENAIGIVLSDFDKRYHKDYSSTQPVEVNLNYL